MNYKSKLAVLALAGLTVSSFPLIGMDRQGSRTQNVQLDEQALYNKLAMVAATERNTDVRRQKVENLLINQSVMTTSLFGYAAEYASIDFVKALLDRHVRVTGLDKDDPLFTIISGGTITFGPGKKAREVLLKGNAGTMPPLHRVLKSCAFDPSRVQVVQLLLEIGANPNQYWESWYPVHLLISGVIGEITQEGKQAFFQILELLFQKDIDQLQKDWEGKTPLLTAWSQLNSVRALSAHELNTAEEKAYFQKQALFYEELIAVLEKKLAGHLDVYGITSNRLFMSGEEKSKVDLIIESISRLPRVTTSTLLSGIVQFCPLQDIIALLLRGGDQVKSLLNPIDQIPPLYALLVHPWQGTDRAKVAKLLLIAGTDPNKLWNGMTALHYLITHYMYGDFAKDGCEEMFFEMVQLLLQHHADLSKCSEKGRTPREEAQAVLWCLVTRDSFVDEVNKALHKRVAGIYEELIRKLQAAEVTPLP